MEFKDIMAAIMLLLTGNDTPVTEPPGMGTLELVAADKSAVAPCPNQAILSDATELASFKNALLNGTLLYLDEPWNGNDPDTYRNKCGLEGFWDPTTHVNEISLQDIGLDPNNAPTITDLVLFGNSGICAANFDNGSFGTGEGFPVAGTYRHEVKAALAGQTWHFRFRAIVSGPVAGNTFAAEGLAPSTDLETLVYAVDGITTPHDGVFDAVVSAMTVSGADAPGATVEVRRSANEPVIFTTIIEVICVQEI
ncbi:MAG: hypothetical protein KDI88_05595 [Gammaproteobacteria bacterium]|nr:hypothetical protein [Gammaproteobacteria bacterium]